MLQTILFGIATLLVSLIGTYGLGLPGFDLTLAGMILLAHTGENITIAAIILSIAYMLPKPDRFAWFPPCRPARHGLPGGSR